MLCPAVPFWKGRFVLSVYRQMRVKSLEIFRHILSVFVKIDE